MRALLAGQTTWAKFCARTNCGAGFDPLRDGADLTHAQLAQADLRGFDLRGVDFRRAYLVNADLRGADLRQTTLIDANMIGANLRRANLRGAYLHNASLRLAALTWADLTGALLPDADLSAAKCRRAVFREASLENARLVEADLGGADFTRADLRGSSLVRARMDRCSLRNCQVYGASVWDVDLADAIQTDLVASPEGQPALVTDSLEVAQFLYLLLKNPKVRDVIDTIGKKAVLILGRFSPERMAVLNAMRATLRRRGWVPILFDFEVPATRDMTETVTIIAHLSRFVIADLTDPRSVQQELTAILPDIPSVAVQPVIHVSQDPWSMFGDLGRRYAWLLKPYRYESLETLLAALETHVVGPAEAKARELTAAPR